MKLGCYGYDATFQNLFPPIITEWERRGHEKPVVFLPLMRGIVVERKDEMRDCDLGLLGLSSFQTQEELELVDAFEKIVIIADVPGSELRPKAQGWVQAQCVLPRASRKLKGLLLALESSRQAAIDFGYLPEDIYYFGPPPHWGHSYRQMTEIDVATVRATLFKRRGDGAPEPLSTDDVVVYVPGTKMPLVVNAMLRCAIHVGKEIFGSRFVLAFAPHPGEKPEKPNDEVMFARAFGDREMLREGLWELDVSKLTNPQRYAIAEKLKIVSGGPTETIMAAYARDTSMAYWRDEDVLAFLAASGVEGGRWFIAELEAACPVGPENYLERICFLLSPRGQAYIRAKQEEHFPLPKTWDTAPAIVDFLEKVAGE